MANYYGNCRTNWVKVKPDKIEEFKDFFSKLNQCHVDEDEGKCMVMDKENDIPFTRFDDEGDCQEEVDWEPLAAMLEEGEVLHFVGVGQEKMRYLEGVGFFIMSDGTTSIVNINEPPSEVRLFLAKHGKEHATPTY